LTDLKNELVKVLRESDPGKKKELQEKLASETVPTHLKFFEERLAKSGSGYLGWSGFTWGDIYLYIIQDWFPNKDAVLEKFPHVKALKEKVESNPGIANWLKVRPVTEM